MAASEVKGVWFMTARRYVVKEHGEEMLSRCIQASSPVAREAMRDPVVSRWYPEGALRDAMEAFHAVVSRGLDARFATDMEACTVLGANWFVQVLASISTPTYLVKQLPAGMRLMRRGGSTLSVEPRERGATVRLVDLPYADDARYRIATPACVRALLGLCLGRATARVTLASFTRTTQVVDVAW